MRAVGRFLIYSLIFRQSLRRIRNKLNCLSMSHAVVTAMCRACGVRSRHIEYEAVLCGARVRGIEHLSRQNPGGDGLCHRDPLILIGTERLRSTADQKQVSDESLLRAKEAVLANRTYR